MITPRTRLTPRLLSVPLALFLLLIIYTHQGILTIFEQYSITPPSKPPTLHLIGDSSMCKGGTNDGVKGVKYEGTSPLLPQFLYRSRCANRGL